MARSWTSRRFLDHCRHVSKSLGRPKRDTFRPADEFWNTCQTWRKLPVELRGYGGQVNSVSYPSRHTSANTLCSTNSELVAPGIAEPEPSLLATLGLAPAEEAFQRTGEYQTSALGALIELDRELLAALPKAANENAANHLRLLQRLVAEATG